MANQFSRTELLIGSENIEKLNNSRVAVFGIGGVGSFTAEALVRAGVGSIDLIDSDEVSVTNINRQIIALHSTVGRAKVDVARDRLLDINPNAVVVSHNMFFTDENAHELDFSNYDYVVDAIDTVTSKLLLVQQANESNTPIICSMGTGNKLDPTALEVADIYDTSVCPLARVMRTELRKRGVKELKVVYSKEEPLKPADSDEKMPQGRRQTPGSVSFVPSVAGLIIAGEVIKDLIK